MRFKNPYASKNLKAYGVEVDLLDINNNILKGKIVFNKSTRSTFDLSFREKSIDGTLTITENLSNIILQSGYIFKMISDNKIRTFLLQTINFNRIKENYDFNAVEANYNVNVIRKQKILDDNGNQIGNKDVEIYKNIPAFIYDMNRSQKLYDGGFSIETIITVQISKHYNLLLTDRLVVSENDKNKKLIITSLGGIGLDGIIDIQCKFEE